MKTHLKNRSGTRTLCGIKVTEGMSTAYHLILAEHPKKKLPVCETCKRRYKALPPDERLS